MQEMWNKWKSGFTAWEEATAKYTEAWLKSPLVLGPSGAILSALMKAKAASDNAAAGFWANLGLPTKRDQERALHLLNQLNSRILDLEERLADRK
jgi:hypothetical protein